MSFGFSVGDVIFCSKLAFSAYNALKDAPKEFEGLRLEVLSLNATLRALAEEANSPNSIILLASPQRQESLRVLLDNCSKGLQQLQVLTKKFPSLGSNEKTKFLEHVKFSFQNKNGPRDKLAIHTASINIFLTSLTHSSLGRLEGLIKNALRGSQQKQQSSQSQFSTAGYETLGTKSFAAFASDFDVAPQPAPAKDPDVWSSISQDLEWEGMRVRDVQPLKDEIVAYIRYLHNGGEPFWKRGLSKVEQDAMKQGRTMHSARPPQSSSDHSYARDYERRPSTRPTPPMYPPSNQVPPAYSPSAPPGQQVGFGRASSASHGASSQHASGSPAQFPNGRSYLFEFGLAGDSRPTGAVSNNDAFERRKDEKKPSFSFGQTGSSQPGERPLTNEIELAKESKRLEAVQLAQEEGAKQAKVEQAPIRLGSSFGVGDTAGRPQASSAGLFGGTPAATSSQQGSSLFGGSQSNAASGSVFEAPSTQYTAGSKPLSGTTPFTSGSLFGGTTATASATNSGGPFGNASSTTNTQQKPTELFGSAPPKSGGSLFGSTPSTNLFGQPIMNEEELDEMSDLFDHMFDVDEAEAAITQGTPIDAPYPPSPRYEPIDPRYDQSTYERPILSSSGSPVAYFGSTATEYSSYDTHLHPTTSPDDRIPPPITADTPVELRRARLRIVKGQLESLLERIYAAHRVGNTTLPYLLLYPSLSNNNESPIHARVAYLRSAGAIVVNCDLCSAPVPDYHWHCDVCAGGDWDCCFHCRTSGRGCPGSHTYLTRRSAKEWEKERYWTNL